MKDIESMIETSQTKHDTEEITEFLTEASDMFYSGHDTQWPWIRAEAYTNARLSGLEPEDWDEIAEFYATKDLSKPENVSLLQGLFFKLGTNLTTRTAGIAGSGKGWGSNRALAQMFIGSVAVNWGAPICAEFEMNEAAAQLRAAGVDVVDKSVIDELRNEDLDLRLAHVDSHGNGLVIGESGSNGKLCFMDRENIGFRVMTRIEHTLLLVRWSWACARAFAAIYPHPFHHRDTVSLSQVTLGDDYDIISVAFDATLNRKTKQQSKGLLEKMPHLKRQSDVTPASTSPYPFSFVGGYVTAPAGFAAPRAINRVILPMPKHVLGNKNVEEEE